MPQIMSAVEILFEIPFVIRSYGDSTICIVLFVWYAAPLR